MIFVVLVPNSSVSQREEHNTDTLPGTRLDSRTGSTHYITKVISCSKYSHLCHISVKFLSSLDSQVENNPTANSDWELNG